MKYGWAMASFAAAALLVVLALQGTDRSTRLEQFEAAGPMRDLALDSVTEVLIDAGAKHWRFVREGERWRAEPAVAGTPETLATKLRTALTLMRNSSPERSFDAVAPQFGFDTPTIRVQVLGRNADEPKNHEFRALFGAINPIGLAHYAQLQFDQKASVVLMPSYVAQAWQAIIVPP